VNTVSVYLSNGDPRLDLRHHRFCARCHIPDGSDVNGENLARAPDAQGSLLELFPRFEAQSSNLGSSAPAEIEPVRCRSGEEKNPLRLESLIWTAYQCQMARLGERLCEEEEA
jgi:hypothetical protein